MQDASRTGRLSEGRGGEKAFGDSVGDRVIVITCPRAHSENVNLIGMHGEIVIVQYKYNTCTVQ